MFWNFDMDCKPVRTPLKSVRLWTLTGVRLHEAVNNSDTNELKLSYRELLASFTDAPGSRDPLTCSRCECIEPMVHFLQTNPLDMCQENTQISQRHHQQRTVLHKMWNLIGYTDANWGNCGLDRRSYISFVFLSTNVAILWESWKQRAVVLSSTETEYTALSDVARKAIYLSNLLSAIGLSSLSKVTLHDNQDAAKLAVNPIFHSQSKYIDIRCHFIRDRPWCTRLVSSIHSRKTLPTF